MTLRVFRDITILGTFVPLKHKTIDHSNISICKEIWGIELPNVTTDCGAQRGDAMVQYSEHAIGMTYGVKSVVGALEMYHTIQARERCPSTLATVGIQLLLRKHVSTALSQRED